MSLDNEDLTTQNTVNQENEEVKTEFRENSETVAAEETAGEELSESDKMAAELAEMKVKYAELSNSHLRLMAEFDNYRKRTLKEKSELIKNGGETALTRVLTVVDDFDRAMNALKSATEISAVVEGIELIYSKFADFLKQNNVTLIETENCVFDTEFHEAITTIPAPSEEMKGKIIDCVQKGYKLNDKVIRFAKVVVGE